MESKPGPAVAEADDLSAFWVRVAELARVENPSVLSVVESTRLEQMSGSSARLAIISDANTSYIRARKSALEALLQKVTGRTLRVEFVEAFADEARGAGDERKSPRTEVDPVAQAQAMKDPVVRRAVDLFGARIVEITQDEPSEER